MLPHGLIRQCCLYRLLENNTHGWLAAMWFCTSQSHPSPTKSRVLWSFDRLCKWEWDIVFVYLCALTLRKYLMFLLWKSPGGSNRYRSSSHKSRRKPEKHTRALRHHICGKSSLHDSVKCKARHIAGVRLPSSSLCEVHTTSRQIFLSISTSASKKESTSSSVMSPVQTSLLFIVIITTNVKILIIWLDRKLYGRISLHHKCNQILLCSLSKDCQALIKLRTT